MSNKITIARVERYLSLTAEARQKATPTTSTEKEEKMLKDLLSMCDNYSSDARHFASQGDLVNAFGAINYAHAWIDAAVRLGLMSGHGDDSLFTLP